MRVSRNSRRPVIYDPSRTATGRLKRLLRWLRSLTPCSFLALVCLIAVLVYGFIRLKEQCRRALRWVHPPPLYGEYHKAELALPQHDISKAFDRGQKYLWVNNHVSGLGWGNYLEDLIMNGQIAYSSGRAFVFDNFTWNRDNKEYSEYSGKLIPSQIPLSVLISGPLVGGPFIEGDRTPLAVHKDLYDAICPNPTILDTKAVQQMINDERASASTILNTWAEYLNSIEDPCVEIARRADRIFDYYIYGQKERMLTIWPTLSRSPVLSTFGWSPLVHAAFDVNRALFSPVPLIEPYTCPQPFTRCSDPSAPLLGLLVLHVRRGDFAEHCAHLARWNASFNAFNSFDALPDHWTRPPGGGGGQTTPQNMKLYMRRCFPTVQQITDKVREVLRSPQGRGLADVYIMTNGKARWVNGLKGALAKTGAFRRIASSRDLELSTEQKYVAQAVDMLIGQRAQVLIGNGFSSLTSDIVMMRMARRLPPDTNRFW